MRWRERQSVAAHDVEIVRRLLWVTNVATRAASPPAVEEDQIP